MKNPEILAPAGAFESVAAAASCGADAVYLGLPRFSARAAAQNFTFDDLQKTVRYCRARGLKVYLAFNTLLFGDRELAESIPLIEKACGIGVDAFIVQDLGAAKLIHEIAPDAVLHASTQMSLMSSSGIEAAAKLGMRRVVLARELSKAELSELTHLGMETEVFVHGALCMSVSGQCYLSATLGGRSGNRGRCAGPCRLPFEGDCHALSLKDLSLVDRLGELRDLGVTSFKIEGRLRRPEYVAAAVTACRRVLAGETPDIEKLTAAFSRSGFTSGYYDNRLGPRMFGVRTQDDAADTQKALLALRALWEKAQPAVPVRFDVKIRAGEPISAQAMDDDGNESRSGGPAPSRAVTRPVSKDDVERAFRKTLDTPFFMDGFETDIGEGLFVGMSELNRLRRDCLESLEEKRAQPKAIKMRPYGLPPAAMRTQRIPKLRAVFARTVDASGDGFSPLEMAAVPEEMLGCAGGIQKVAIKLPRASFGDDSGGVDDLRRLMERGIGTAYAPHLGAAFLARRAGLQVWGGFTLNCANRLCAGELFSLGVRDVTLSAEVHPKRILSDMPDDMHIGAVVYGALPLMLMRNCPLKNSPRYRGCKRGNCHLADRYGVHFPLLCRDGMCEMFNSRPMWLADRLQEFSGLDFITLYFTTEDSERCKRVIDAYANGDAPNIEFTRGMYYQKIE